MKEIGSEFWTIDLDDNDNNLEYLNIGNDYKLLMSGRTAIDYVLNEIDDNKKVVYMPNYCCESMTKPFVDNGYRIEYYNVDIINNNYDINIDFDCSVFFAMSYFGYNVSNMDKYIGTFNERNIIVIEDITHRFLSDINYCKHSDYLVCSLRKWFPILSGGIAVSNKNKFKKDLDDYTINEDFLNKKKKAMDLKRDYINNIDIDKETFLNLFNESNNLIEDYKNKKIDDISLSILKHLDIKEIKNKRIKNTKLIEKLINNKDIKIIYKYNKGDCPLYVPISISNRNNIRQKLINNNVYLPVHWPNFNSFDNDIYDNELSLINDQRYDLEDIENYINKLIKIIEE